MSAVRDPKAKPPQVMECCIAFSSAEIDDYARNRIDPETRRWHYIGEIARDLQSGFLRARVHHQLVYSCAPSPAKPGDFIMRAEARTYSL